MTETEKATAAALLDVLERVKGDDDGNLTDEEVAALRAVIEEGKALASEGIE